MPDSLRDQLIDRARQHRNFSEDATVDVVDALLPLIQAHVETEQKQAIRNFQRWCREGEAVIKAWKRGDYE